MRNWTPRRCHSNLRAHPSSTTSIPRPHFSGRQWRHVVPLFLADTDDLARLSGVAVDRVITAASSSPRATFIQREDRGGSVNERFITGLLSRAHHRRVPAHATDGLVSRIIVDLSRDCPSVSAAPLSRVDDGVRGAECGRCCFWRHDRLIRLLLAPRYRTSRHIFSFRRAATLIPRLALVNTEKDTALNSTIHFLRR